MYKMDDIIGQRYMAYEIDKIFSTRTIKTTRYLSKVQKFGTIPSNSKYKRVRQGEPILAKDIYV